MLKTPYNEASPTLLFRDDDNRDLLPVRTFHRDTSIPSLFQHELDLDFGSTCFELSGSLPQIIRLLPPETYFNAPGFLPHPKCGFLLLGFTSLFDLFNAQGLFLPPFLAEEVH